MEQLPWLTFAKNAQVSQSLKAQVKIFEGFAGAPYKDAAGNWTGGWGHRLISNSPEWISTAQAETWLDHDLFLAAIPVRHLVTAEITQAQFDAMVDFCFNVGNGNFTKSNIWRYVNKGMIAAAAAEMKLYCHAAGVVLPGLLKRRKWEADQMNR
jgi:lysozyme